MAHKFGKGILTALAAVAILLVSSPLVFAAAEVIPAGESYIKVIFAFGAGIKFSPLRACSLLSKL